MQPTQLGPYSIGSRLGRGGMGAVYEGVDTFGGGAVAIKVLATHLADDPGLRRRFETEIDTLKSLRHAGIVQLLAFGEQDGQPYYAMELVRGQSLDKLLRAGRRFTWQETVEAARAITRSLKAAHDRGIIHRDLKPANLLLPDDSPTSAIKLADFGIAKLFGGAAHTALGNVVGTAEYMAPEQAAGKPVDARADLYALGLVMFSMMRGKPPFQSPNVADVMRMQQVTPPPRVATLVPDVPSVVDDLIHVLLTKDPAARPASALALSRLLDAIDTTAAPDVRPIVFDDGATGHGTTQAARARTGTRAASAPPPEGVDLLAPTRDITRARVAASAPGADGTGGEAQAGSRLPTDIASAATQVNTVPRTTHTTLAQIERDTAAAAAREARREQWMRLASAAALILLLGGGGYLLVRPLSADEMHARITSLLAAPDRQDALRDAEPLVTRFLDAFPGDPRAAEVRGLKRALDIDRLRIRAERREKKAVPPHLRIERDYRLAMETKTTDPAACIAALRAILDLPAAVAAAVVSPDAEADSLTRDPELWRGLVAWQIQQLTPIEDAEKRIDRHDAARQPL